MPSVITPGSGASRTEPLPIPPRGERRDVVLYSELVAGRDVVVSLAENERIVCVEGLSMGQRLLWIERSSS